MAKIEQMLKDAEEEEEKQEAKKWVCSRGKDVQGLRIAGSRAKLGLLHKNS